MLELFRVNIRNDPNSGVAHDETARLATGKGDFDTAITEMKIVAAASPEALKDQYVDLERRLQNRRDINNSTIRASFEK